jgi:hypothetical protein
MGEKLSVEFDDLQIRVRVLADLEPSWNQTFDWSNIRRVCFKDGGMLSSDIIYVSLKVAACTAGRLLPAMRESVRTTAKSDAAKPTLTIDGSGSMPATWRFDKVDGWRCFEPS